jgi:hypothetical protein
MNVSRLPHRHEAHVEPAKLIDYLLDRDHPVGGDKAAFLYRFGFRREEWPVLRSALLAHAATAEVVETRATTYGRHFALEGRLETPDGRNPVVRTAWLIPSDERRPRFLTTYPGRWGGQVE